MGNKKVLRRLIKDLVTTMCYEGYFSCTNKKEAKKIFDRIFEDWMKKLKDELV